MKRETLKKLIGDYRKSLVRPEMIDDRHERKLMRSREQINLRYEDGKRALYAKKGLTDEARGKAFDKLQARLSEARERLRPLERICERRRQKAMVELLQMTDPKRFASARRRVAA
jgi:hypothetical protein